MASLPQVESRAQQINLYIGELREFFSSRRVSFGTPADLAAFPSQLNDPAFHEEVVSMVRSVLYRESETLSRSDLLDLVAVAVGGPEIEQDAAGVHEAVRRIFGLVTEVVRAQRFSAVPETESGTIPSSTEATSQAEVMPEGVPANDRLQRALAQSGLGSADEPKAVVSTTEPSGFPLPNAGVRPPRRRRAMVASFFERAYWIPGVCVLVLALGTVFYLTRRHDAVAVASMGTTAPLASAAGSSPPTSLQARPAKPSAYGPALAIGQHVVPLQTEPVEVPVPPQPEAAAAPVRPLARAVTPRAHAGPAPFSTRTSPRILGGREGVFLASSGSMASHLLNAPAPEYPKLASLAHVQGQVIVQVVVDPEGRVEATHVLDGPHLLRGAAEHAIHRWRYRPYLVDGRATDVATIVTVNFRLSQ